MVDGTWLPLADAARALGISIDATRRRVKRGALVGEKRETPQGGAWWVLVPPCGPPPGAQPGDAPPAAWRHLAQDGAGSEAHPDGDAGAWAHLVHELSARLDRTQAELLATASAAALWQGRAEILAHQLEQTRAELRALQAPQDAPESPVAPHLGAEPGEPTSEPSDPPAEPPPPLAPDPLSPKPDGRTPWWRRWWAGLAGT